MKKILIAIGIISNLFSASDNKNSPALSREIIESLTIEQLNVNIAKYPSLSVLKRYLEKKFKDEDFSSLVTDINNKGVLYSKYLEPMIFISKNLKLSNLLGFLNKITDNNQPAKKANELKVYEILEKYKPYEKYNIIDIAIKIKKSSDINEISELTQRLRFLLDLGFVNFKDNCGDAMWASTGNTALIWASGNGDVDMVQLLIDNGADINIKNKDGYTALIWASSEGHLDVVRLLLDAGANANIKDNWGNTALDEAILNGYINISKLLEEYLAKL